MKYFAAIFFFIFICWITIQADMGIKNQFTVLVKSIPYGDKFGHLVLYGCFALLVNIATNFRRISIGDFKVLLGATLVALFAIFEEFTQIAFQTRNFEIADIICDLLGIIIFSWLSLIIYQSRFWLILK